jgi:hypothetical protein
MRVYMRVWIVTVSILSVLLQVVGDKCIDRQYIAYGDDDNAYQTNMCDCIAGFYVDSWCTFYDQGRCEGYMIEQCLKCPVGTSSYIGAASCTVNFNLTLTSENDDLHSNSRVEANTLSIDSPIVTAFNSTALKSNEIVISNSAGLRVCLVSGLIGALMNCIVILI